MHKITLILLLGLFFNVSKCLEESKNACKSKGCSAHCVGSTLVFEFTVVWENAENLPPDFDLNLAQTDGNEAKCHYSKANTKFDCKLEKSGLIQFPETTMKVGEDEYTLRAYQGQIYCPCNSSSSKFYSISLILLLLNILLI
jgi:hypothetical protein